MIETSGMQTNSNMVCSDECNEGSIQIQEETEGNLHGEKAPVVLFLRWNGEGRSIC